MGTTFETQLGRSILNAIETPGITHLIFAGLSHVFAEVTFSTA